MKTILTLINNMIKDHTSNIVRATIDAPNAGEITNTFKKAAKKVYSDSLAEIGTDVDGAREMAKLIQRTAMVEAGHVCGMNADWLRAWWDKNGAQ